MADREAPGDFDYLWDDQDSSDGAVLDERRDPGDDLWDDPDDNLWYDDETELGAEGPFEVFGPAPWFRTRPASIGLIATAGAAAAIVVSGVLLVLRGPAHDVQQPVSVSSTAPVTSVPSMAPATITATTAPSSEPSTPPLDASPPPPEPESEPPPPPEPESAPSTIDAPAPTSRPTPERPRRDPEIGVTRTPETR